MEVCVCWLNSRSALLLFPNRLEPAVIAAVQEKAAWQEELCAQNDTGGAFNTSALNAVFCYKHQD